MPAPAVGRTSLVRVPAYSRTVTTPDPAGVRYARDVGPGDRDVRVSLRRRLAEGGLGDLLGMLEQWSDGVVVVQDRHGTRHHVDEQDVVAVKRVPPAPERRR
jgi:hypothetical protein